MTERRNPNVLDGSPKIFKIAAIGFALLILSMVLTRTTFMTIDPGQRGVLFKRFAGGIQVDRIYDQGFHVVAPWNKMYIYDVRVDEALEEMKVLSKNGLDINVELSFRYNPVFDKIGFLHNEIGPDYVGRILKPEIRSATREVIGKYSEEELYSTKREAIQDEIFTRTRDAVKEKHLVLDAVLIREIELPQQIKSRIEEKLGAEQEALRYDYLLDQERKEAERKVIEAQAKADANRILNASLTSNILKDKGIEATMQLANSPNSKVVVVGGGDGGLPLILGN